MAVREIGWPRDLTALARSLSGASAWFWLDGEAEEPGGGRGFSYLGAAGELRCAQRGEEREFLHTLRESVRGAPADSVGWAVALSYEFGVALMGEDPAADDAPPAFAMRADIVLVLDHERGRAELRGPTEAAIDDWLVEHGQALQQGTEADDTAESDIEQLDTAAGQLHAKWRWGKREYLESIDSCKQAIGEGDAYVLCLTDTAEIRLESADPLRLFLALRRDHPALRGGLLVARERALVSASPERFLSVRGSAVRTSPIKGTVPRGTTPEQDSALALQLARDPKERAENLMIVDLLRNDLSRVCSPGTIAVEKLLDVEQHPRVHQLVSTISGRLRDDSDAFDVIEACFPGGSMTGAPKRRAVQLLGSLEAAPRGLYSGAFGWIENGRGLELAMTIRCIELRGIGADEVRALVGAGGGITADSEPAAEYAEKQLKAASLLNVLGEPPERYS